MDATIDTLQLQIEASASEASKKLLQLENRLKKLEQTASQTSGLSSVSNKLKKVGGALSAIKFGAVYAGMKKVFSITNGWITKSNEYVENLNLFRVAMGDAADEAEAYAKKVNEALGIDMSEFIRNQGIFKQITSGFGVVDDKANRMSKNLTQIGYDIASFYNIDIEEAMQKVQSGISGELEPLRRLGYALDQATLQQLAYENGIEQSIHTMTQAQKSQLRYLAIMEQSENVMGDMARTIETPANSIRVLQQQITQLGRAMGNLLLPVIQKVLPYLQAFVELATDAVQSLAELFGFELPTIDYEGLGGLASGAEDAASAIGDATEAVKELKNATLGIDELNVIGKDSGSSDGSGSFGADLDLPLPEYDFLGNVQRNVDEIKEKMSGVFDIVVAIGGAMLAWKVSSGIASLLSHVGSGLGAGTALTLGLTLVATIAGLVVAANQRWKAQVKEWYESSGLSKEVELFKSYVEEQAQVSVTIKSRLDAAYDPINNLEADYAKLKLFVDQIYLLVDQEEKSVGEMSALKSLIGDVNAMNIDGLQLEYDETTDAINMTRDAVYKLINAQFDQLRAEAYIEAYGDMYKERLILEQKIEQNQWRLSEAEAKRNSILAEMNSQYDWLEKNWWRRKFATEDEIAEIDAVAKQYFTNKEAVSQLDTAIGELTGVIEEDNNVLNETTGILNGIEQAYGGMIIAANTAAQEIPKSFGAIEASATSLLSKLNEVYSSKFDAGVTGLMSDEEIFAMYGLNGYASGGVPQTGELFMARESGPELVGTIGGRTAVMNNEQIVAAVAAGVYDAVVSAQSGQNNAPQSVNVYLDGKQIEASVRGTKHRQGAVIGTGGIYNYA